MKNFYITTPIYYSTGKPHIGHAYSTIMTDVLFRYKKLIGYNAFFLTGMDEHGQKVVEKAKENGLLPQEFVDHNAEIFKNLWTLLDIKESFFIRTTNQKHIKFVQEIFSILYKKDYLYKSTWNTMYCVSCEENIRDSDIVIKNDKETCIHGHDLISKSEESYFLRVTMFKDWLINYYESNKDFIFPSKRVKELVSNFLNEEFEDLSVTRTNVKWGIQFLEDKEHTIYVWIDALLNYLSSLEINHQLDDYWQLSTEKIHVLSKEITRFHCIYWPIILKMLDLPLPTKILSHGWIITRKVETNETIKMSKSLNNVIDPIDIINDYDSDTLRYFLMKQISVTNDTVFDPLILLSTYNSDLANNFGNIISRTIGMITKYNNGIVPDFNKPTIKINELFLSDIENLFNYVIKKINELNVNKIVDGIEGIANSINSFIEKSKPWEYFKNNQTVELNEFLSLLYNSVKVYVVSLTPILTKKTILAINQLNFKTKSLELKKLFDYNLKKQIKVKLSEPILPRKSDNLKAEKYNKKRWGEIIWITKILSLNQEQHS